MAFPLNAESAPFTPSRYEKAAGSTRNSSVSSEPRSSNQFSRDGSMYPELVKVELYWFPSCASIPITPVENYILQPTIKIRDEDGKIFDDEDYFNDAKGGVTVPPPKPSPRPFYPGGGRSSPYSHEREGGGCFTTPPLPYYGGSSSLSAPETRFPSYSTIPPIEGATISIKYVGDRQDSSVHTPRAPSGGDVFLRSNPLGSISGSSFPSPLLNDEENAGAMSHSPPLPVTLTSPPSSHPSEYKGKTVAVSSKKRTSSPSPPQHTAASSSLRVSPSSTSSEPENIIDDGFSKNDVFRSSFCTDEEVGDVWNQKTSPSNEEGSIKKTKIPHPSRFSSQNKTLPGGCNPIPLPRADLPAKLRALIAERENLPPCVASSSSSPDSVVSTREIHARSSSHPLLFASSNSITPANSSSEDLPPRKSSDRKQAPSKYLLPSGVTSQNASLTSPKKSRLYKLEFRWFRSPPRAVCCFHQHLVAAIQCNVTLRCFCGYDCFARGFNDLQQFYLSKGVWKLLPHFNPHVYGVPCRGFDSEDFDSNRDLDHLHLNFLSMAGLCGGGKEGGGKGGVSGKGTAGKGGGVRKVAGKAAAGKGGFGKCGGLLTTKGGKIASLRSSAFKPPRGCGDGSDGEGYHEVDSKVEGLWGFKRGGGFSERNISKNLVGGGGSEEKGGKRPLFEEDLGVGAKHIYEGGVGGGENFLGGWGVGGKWLAGSPNTNGAANANDVDDSIQLATSFDWELVGIDRNYRPCAKDIGRQLRLECLLTEDTTDVGGGGNDEEEDVEEGGICGVDTMGFGGIRDSRERLLSHTQNGSVEQVGMEVPPWLSVCRSSQDSNSSGNSRMNVRANEDAAHRWGKFYASLSNGLLEADEHTETHSISEPVLHSYPGMSSEMLQRQLLFPPLGSQLIDPSLPTPHQSLPHESTPLQSPTHQSTPHQSSPYDNRLNSLKTLKTSPPTNSSSPSFPCLHWYEGSWVPMDSTASPTQLQQRRMSSMTAQLAEGRSFLTPRQGEKDPPQLPLTIPYDLNALPNPPLYLLAGGGREVNPANEMFSMYTITDTGGGFEHAHTPVDIKPKSPFLVTDCSFSEGPRFIIRNEEVNKPLLDTSILMNDATIFSPSMPPLVLQTPPPSVNPPSSEVVEVSASSYQYPLLHTVGHLHEMEGKRGVLYASTTLPSATDFSSHTHPSSLLSESFLSNEASSTVKLLSWGEYEGEGIDSIVVKTTSHPLSHDIENGGGDGRGCSTTSSLRLKYASSTPPVETAVLFPSPGDPPSGERLSRPFHCLGERGRRFLKWEEREGGVGGDEHGEELDEEEEDEGLDGEDEEEGAAGKGVPRHLQDYPLFEYEDSPYFKSILTACCVPYTERSPIKVFPSYCNPSALEMMKEKGWDSITVMTWNILAEIYGTHEAFPHCDSYMLAWAYRRDKILQELLAQSCDVICLQEVQIEHFEEFFQPALAEFGYEGIYKKKNKDMFAYSTSGARNSYRYTIDGCATFYKKNKFRVLKSFGLDFGKMMNQSLKLHLPPEVQENSRLIGRLQKDNVALVVFLELIDESSHSLSPSSSELGDGSSAALIERGASGRTSLPQVIIANTHIVANPEARDVKIWQAQLLLSTLENYLSEISSDATYLTKASPGLIVCGDFNSTPESAVYDLITKGSCDRNHEDFSTDKSRILKDFPFGHSLHLKSAVAMARAFLLLGDKANLQELKDTKSFEPSFTICSKGFTGALDYIFYSENMGIISIIDVIDLEALHQEALEHHLLSYAIPNAQRPSDHIPLSCEFQWIR